MTAQIENFFHFLFPPAIDKGTFTIQKGDIVTRVTSLATGAIGILASVLEYRFHNLGDFPLKMRSLIGGIICIGVASIALYFFEHARAKKILEEAVIKAFQESGEGQISKFALKFAENDRALANSILKNTIPTASKAKWLIASSPLVRSIILNSVNKDEFHKMILLLVKDNDEHVLESLRELLLKHELAKLTEQQHGEIVADSLPSYLSELVIAGLPPNAKSIHFGYTPLMLIAIQADLSDLSEDEAIIYIQKLCKLGADPNITTTQGSKASDLCDIQKVKDVLTELEKVQN